MAANQSIKELMAAETKASKIISEARQGAYASSMCCCTTNGALGLPPVRERDARASRASVLHTGSYRMGGVTDESYVCIWIYMNVCVACVD